MKKLAKRILSFLLVFITLTAASPVDAAEQDGKLELQITPSVSKAAVGDVIEYTVTASGSNVLAMECKLSFPEGLSYVANSAAVPKGLADRLGWASTDWTEESGKWTGYNDYGVEFPAGTVILTFCAVAEAEGDYQVEFLNLWPYAGNLQDLPATVKTDSVSIVKQTPVKVNGLTVSDVEQKGFALSWNEVPGASKYWIYLNGVAYTSTKGCSVAISNRKPGTDYEVKVVAAMDDGSIQSLKDADALNVRTPEAVVTFAGTATEETITLTWDATGCEKTWIYMGLSADVMKPMYGSTTDTFTVTDLEPNTTYYFQLAHSKSGNFVMGDTVLAVKTLAPEYPIRVTGLQSTNVEQNRFTVTWDATPDAAKYWVYLNGVAYSSTTGTSFTIAGRTPNTAYQVKVVAAFDGGIMQAVTKAQTLTVRTLDVPVVAPGFTVVSTESGVALTWDATGCDKTWIYMGLSADSLKPMYGSTTGSYTITNLDADTTYYFRLVHSMSGKMVASEDILSVKVTASRPTKVTGLTAAEVGQTSFTVTWDAVPDADKYWVYLNGVAYTSTKSNSITVENRKSGTAYELKIIACFADKKTQSVKNADALTVTTLG